MAESRNARAKCSTTRFIEICISQRYCGCYWAWATRVFLFPSLLHKCARICKEEIEMERERVVDVGSQDAVADE